MELLKSTMEWIRWNPDLSLLYLSFFVIFLLVVALVISYFQIRKWKKAEEEAHNEWLKWRGEANRLQSLLASQTTELVRLSNTLEYRNKEIDDDRVLIIKLKSDYDTLCSIKNKSDAGFRRHIQELKNGLRLKALQQSIIVSRKHWQEHVDPIYNYLIGR
jgi:hypothetical protein